MQHLVIYEISLLIIEYLRGRQPLQQKKSISITFFFVRSYLHHINKSRLEFYKNQHEKCNRKKTKRSTLCGNLSRKVTIFQDIMERKIIHWYDTPSHYNCEDWVKKSIVEDSFLITKHYLPCKTLLEKKVCK